MSSVNQCNFVGNAGKDSEMSYTTSGTPVTRFSLAVKDYTGKNDKGEPLYKTTWINVIAWNGLAETSNKIVAKGGMYFVSGRLNLRDYTDKQGVQRTNVELIATNITPLSKPSTKDTPGHSNNLDNDLSELDSSPF